jgi:hypothetical protein
MISTESIAIRITDAIIESLQTGCVALVHIPEEDNQRAIAFCNQAVDISFFKDHEHGIRVVGSSDGDPVEVLICNNW